MLRGQSSLEEGCILSQHRLYIINSEQKAVHMSRPFTRRLPSRHALRGLLWVSVVTRSDRAPEGAAIDCASRDGKDPFKDRRSFVVLHRGMFRH